MYISRVVIINNNNNKIILFLNIEKYVNNRTLCEVFSPETNLTPKTTQMKAQSNTLFSFETGHDLQSF